MKLNLSGINKENVCNKKNIDLMQCPALMSGLLLYAMSLHDVEDHGCPYLLILCISKK